MRNFLLILIIAVCCSKVNAPRICTYYEDSKDSALSNFEWTGSTKGWKRPIYKFWTKMYGTAYYRTSDTTIQGYNDTIIFPLLTGWIISGTVVSSNWDTTYNYDGIKANGMPYWLDSLELVSYELGNEPQVDISFQRSMPYWMPSMLPLYIKNEREVDAWWMQKFPYWPEIPNEYGKLNPRYFDSLDFCFAIGDTVEILNYRHATYKLKFIMDHQKDPCWTEDDIFADLWEYETDPRDYYSKYGYGIITDRWKEEINGIKYYRLLALYDYDSYAFPWRNVVKIAEELRAYTAKKPDWSNAGQ